MLNRWIARACIGLALLGGGLSASFAWAQNQTQQSVQSYVNITLPAIARMKPWIDKSAAERATAFATMGLATTVCDAPTTEAGTSGESIAEGAGDLCQAMIAWMQNEDIFTCSRVRFSGNEFAHTEQVDQTVARLHKSQGILSTRAQLEKAAGCTKKTVSYWGPKVIGFLDQLMVGVSNTGDLRAPSSGGVAPTADALQNTLFLCHLAYNGDENTKSAVVDAADDACYAMGYLLNHKPVLACQTLDKSIKKIAAAPGNDPLASEAKVLSEKLSQRLVSIDCETQLAITRAAEAKARAAQQTAAPAPVNDPYAKRNAIVGQINGEQQSLDNSLDVAQRWFDRGEDGEACGYYQKALNSFSSLQSLYSDLRQETGDSDYSAKSNDMKRQHDTLFQNVSDMCLEAEHRLY